MIIVVVLKFLVVYLFICFLCMSFFVCLFVCVGFVCLCGCVLFEVYLFVCMFVLCVCVYIYFLCVFVFCVYCLFRSPPVVFCICQFLYLLFTSICINPLPDFLVPTLLGFVLAWPEFFSCICFLILYLLVARVSCRYPSVRLSGAFSLSDSVVAPWPTC